MDNWTVERNAGHAYGVDYRRHLKYWIEQLRLMPTIHQGQWGDLKYEDDRVRVWFRRDPDWMERKNPPRVQIEISDPDGNWQQVEDYTPKSLPVSPWGGREERERHWRSPFNTIRIYNREAWAIDQGWKYPLPYFYGSGSIQRCANDHLCSGIINLGNDLRQDYGIKLAWLSMNDTAKQICPICRAALEPYAFDPLNPSSNEEITHAVPHS